MISRSKSEGTVLLPQQKPTKPRPPPNQQTPIPLTSSLPTTSLLAQPLQFSRPTIGKSEACLLLGSLLALAFSVCALVWEMFWKVSVVCFAISLALAVYGVFSNKYHAGTILPLSTLTPTLSLLSLLGASLTYADYQSKCVRHRDLSHRSLQSAFAFACEWDTVMLWLWSLGLLCGAVCYLLVGLSGISVVRKFGHFQRVMGCRQTIRNGILPMPFAIVLSLAFVALSFSFLMVDSFSGHKTGVVSGECPVGADFFTVPERNDLGCCDWVTSPGTCCHQTACNHKPHKTSFKKISSSDACDDLVGLLTCAPCHANSGMFARSMTNVTVCAGFCHQLYTTCCSTDCASTTAQNFCESTFGLIVADASNTTYCFNGGGVPSIAITCVVFALASMFWNNL